MDAHKVHLTLQLYEGDCDNDSECAAGLKYFERSGFEQVHDCNGNDIDDSGYCIHPTVTDYGMDANVDHSPLQLCEGDCDNDSHCKDGLKYARLDPITTPSRLLSKVPSMLTSTLPSKTPKVLPSTVPSLLPSS